ncbi:MAG: response regulator [Verrucomicrobiota bacterium]|jgi:two-component system cell cycle response regulator
MRTKILTVDDSKTIRLIVAKAFKPFDCMVLEADNGVVGLAVASREKPDVILLDYTMPVMDGFEVLARLRSDPDLKTTPVIMLTSEAGRDTVIKIAKLGVRDYLIKPFKGELLVERVGRVVDLKTKTAAVERNKRFDDPISILVVDDKPAIPEQIRAALADTPWKVTGADQPGQAIDNCMENGVDLVLASLSLPNDGAFVLFQNLRGCANTASIPILAMCVRTAAAEQARAQQSGFAGVITKPIDRIELKAKVCRTLGLETSYKYFQQRNGALALLLPKDFHPGMAHEVSTHLDGQLAGTVDAGGDKLIIDLNAVETASLPVVELVLSAIQAASKLSLRYAVVGSAAIKNQCHSYEETQSWLFADNFEQALALLK